MSKHVNYNENLVAGAAIRDDKGRRISKLFEASHPKMTVGYAKNLIMPDTPTEQEFNFRQAGDGVIEDGVAVIDKVKGESLVWNQLANKVLNGTTAEKGLTMTLENGVFTVNGTITEDGWVRIGQFWNSLVKGHKTLRVITPISGTCSADFSIGDGYSENDVRYSEKAFINYYNSDDRTTSDFYLISTSGTTFTNLKFKVQSIDLTQVYGAGNEPTTYEEFLSRKPKVADEYAYNEGTIVNNKVEKVVTTGRNLFDSSTAIDGKTIYDDNGAEVNNSLGWCSTFIPIIGGGTYFCKGVRIEVQAYGVHYYDKDKQHINGIGIPQNGGTFDAPINAKYIRIHGLYDSSPANAAILNLSDASFNGQYAPYEKHELDLSWVKDIKDGEGVKLFEDGMKSAGTAFDEATKGKAIKRLGVKVFDGTENFIGRYLAEYGSFVIMGNAFVGVGSSIGISSRYDVSESWVSDPDRTKDDKQIYIDSINNRIWIRDSAFADVDSLKQYLADLYAAGTPLVVYYELAEPIEVEYDEKNLTYPVVAGGTEEAIASEPSSAFRADIGYGIDAVKTILDLKARVEALEAK